MVHADGLSLTLAEDCDLDNLGILERCADSSRAYGLTDASIELFLLIAAAGKNGVTANGLPAKLRKNLAEHLLPLEVKGLVTWERNINGKLAYLVLTWLGDDTLTAAKPRRSQPPRTNPRRHEIAGRPIRGFPQ